MAQAVTADDHGYSFIDEDMRGMFLNRALQQWTSVARKPMGSTAFSMIVGAGSSLIFGWLVQVVSRRRVKPHVATALAVVVGAVAGWEAHAWRFRSELEAAFDGNSSMTALAVRHPELREEFLTYVVERTKAGTSAHDAASMFGQLKMGQYLQEVVADASDEAVVDFTRTYLGVVEDTNKRHDGSCYLLFFGSPEEKARIANTFEDRSWGAVDRLMSNKGQRGDRREIGPEQRSAMNEAFRQRLTATYGEARAATLLDAVGQAGSPTVNREDVCLAIRELWQMVLAMPHPDNARFARSLFAARK